MKTTFTNNQRSGFPRTDYHFQSDRLAGGGILRGGAENFSHLRHEVFHGVNRRGSAREGVLFGALVGVSAWPIYLMVTAVIKLIR